MSRPRASIRCSGRSRPPGAPDRSDPSCAAFWTDCASSPESKSRKPCSARPRRAFTGAVCWNPFSPKLWCFLRGKFLPWSRCSRWVRCVEPGLKTALNKKVCFMIEHPAQAYQGVQADAERERVLMEQLPQVRYIAHRIHERLPRHVPFEDLVHAGVVGLIDALNKFDQSKHVQFSSYAKFRIRGAILDSLRELDWSPRELRRKGRLVDSTYWMLSGKLGRAPNETEIAKEMGISLRELQSLLAELD